MKPIYVAVVVWAALAFFTGCQVRTDAEGKSSPEALSLALEMKDSVGKRVADGFLYLPEDMQSGNTFAGKSQIRVLEMPEQPSTERDHALRCLAQTNGKLSGRHKNGSIHIELHPQTDDNSITLEGQLWDQTLKGKWCYQNYAGKRECGTFEAKRETKKRP